MWARTPRRPPLASPVGLPDYTVVSPVRNEEALLSRTADSLIAQRHRPREWVIVENGSTDGTLDLARSYAAAHDWITVIDAGPNLGTSYATPPVRAFNIGFESLRDPPEIIAKLDGDLFLPPHYFEWVAMAFGRDPRAGIVGGVNLAHDGERWMPEPESWHNARGNNKAYRTACLREIGGLRPRMGWDGIDEYGARARGWNVHVLDELSVLHYRRIGDKLGWRKSRWEEGEGAYYMGYRSDFLAMRAAYRMVTGHPPILGGATMLAGFAASRLRGAPRFEEGPARKLLRDEQRSRMRALPQLAHSAPAIPLPEGGPAFWVGASSRRAGARPPAPSEG